jgi:hypothetical protein
MTLAAPAPPSARWEPGDERADESTTNLLQRATKDAYVAPYGPEWSVFWRLERRGFMAYVPGLYPTVRITDAGRQALARSK